MSRLPDIKYTAADKKKYKTWEWNGSTGGLRARKMLRPQCAICQAGLHAPNWYVACTHDKYWSSQNKYVRIPTWNVDEDPESPTFGMDIMTEELKATRRIRVPNIVEIALTDRIDNNEGPARKRQLFGFVDLTEGGLAPMCMMYGCGRAWPTVQTDFGQFCSEGHAKGVAFDLSEKVLTVYVAPAARGKAKVNEEIDNQVI